MPKQTKRRVEYQKSLVTYLDILGFENLIQTKSAGYISRVLRLVREAIRPDSEDARLFGIQYQSFSDLTVVTSAVAATESVPGSSGLVFWELLGLVHAQADLAEKGILLRGGVTIGRIVKSYGLLYGPALVRAYQLEKFSAIFPRIVVDHSVLEEVRINRFIRHPDHDSRTELEYIQELLATDENDVLFVDYLRAIGSEFSDYADYLKFLNTHRGVILDGLVRYRKKQRIYRKYTWLKKYHNSTVKLSLRRNFVKKYLVT